MKSRYQTFAGYNRWCNERLYEAAAKVPDAEYRKDRGAFFKSLHGTLNHLLVGDRIWTRRFTGAGEMPPSLDAIMYDDFMALRAARQSEDVKIVRYIDRLSEVDFLGTIRYTSSCVLRRSSNRLRPRWITSSSTRLTTAAKRTCCCLRFWGTTRRRASI